MTVEDKPVLVLTDDELLCITGANATEWSLPVGLNEDAATMRASALAGERSLVARGLVAAREGGYSLTETALNFVRPGLQSEPGIVAFVCDDHFRWILQGMSVASYRHGDTAVLELRAANGLHHFLLPPRAEVVRSISNYFTVAFEAGFPDVVDGESLALCVVASRSRRIFRVRKGTIEVAEDSPESLPALEWKPSSLADLLQEVATA